jgi:hypothetical protein
MSVPSLTGLVISKRLAEAMGGRIWCTSEVGQGSVFAFSIHVIVPEGTPPGSSVGVTPSSVVVHNAADVARWPETCSVTSNTPSSHGGTTPVVVPALVSPHIQLTPPYPNARINPYSLSPGEIEVLKKSRVLLLGHREGSLQQWAQLLQIYGCQTHIERSSTSAFGYLSESSLKTPPQKIDLLLMESFDCWSNGTAVTGNESIEELIDPQLHAALLPYAPLSLLFIIDRYYASTRSTPLPGQRMLTPSSSFSPHLGSSISSTSSSTGGMSGMHSSSSESNLGLFSLGSSASGSNHNVGSPSTGLTGFKSDGSSMMGVKPMSHAEKMAFVSEAAVAKLQTRSPALAVRRLTGRKDSASNILGTSSLASPSPALVPSPQHMSYANSPSHAHQPAAKRITTAELAMPFKHRDFLLCVVRQLTRLSESASPLAPSPNTPASLTTAPPSNSSAPSSTTPGASASLPPQPPSYNGVGTMQQQSSHAVPSPTISAHTQALNDHVASHPPAHGTTPTSGTPASAHTPVVASLSKRPVQETRTSKIQNIARAYPLKVLLTEDNLVNQVSLRSD